MNGWTIQGLLDATEGQLQRGEVTRPVAGISIDSRRLRPGEAFLAIRGTRFDGHQFTTEAIHRGASCLIVSDPPFPANGARSLPTIVVEDTTQALGDLACFHRRRFDIPVVAVTGSCGKTTTKDLIAHLVGNPGAILRSPGTQNNHIGLPLALLGLSEHHEMAVVELGSNHPGEIGYLASIAQPTVGVITNVGPAHLEFFGSMMEVLQEKLSLLEELSANGCAILPGDQLDVCLEARNYLHPRARMVYFGTSERCDIQALDVHRLDTPNDRRRVKTGKGMAVRLRDRTQEFVVPLIGYHNVENALAALTCAWTLGIPLEVARARLATFAPLPMRSEVVRCHGVTILNDCYNANPLSFARALELLRDIKAARKIAIVGDMLELGSYAPAAHEAIGRLATQLGIDEVLAVGEYAEFVARGVQEAHEASATPPPGAPASVPPPSGGGIGGATSGGVTTFRTVPELLAGLPARLRRGDGVLIKGSRRLNLEQVAEFLIKRYRRP